ncbi:Rhamnolipids biosynthesis 3-oxoacyl-[acyl-carrier-protein] reductase [Candida viswanathii]|uniref:Rhamnolipids biosynthesis 3-oxoacyl-[acyl-carrier-protein] reductase n=1 Tax=Candida viswanathii TaxID=5486 RepID=A0A367Y5F2_9ASCO|nr:Rhamnolipids biosynthesis 3-oxoacyl-[acyl-carrier-protein] reductase [Candida viswanathii]
MVDFNTNGKVAVVTGGTRGLGLHCAEALVLNGAATVVITSRKQKACDEAQAYLEKLAKDNNKPAKIISYAADLAVEDQCVAFYKYVAERIDKLDILVANAGATWGAPLEDHDVSAVKKVLNLNVVAVFHTIKLFAELLEKAATPEDPSRIILMSSVISFTTNDTVGLYGYLTSKAAVSHLGRNLSVQFAPRHINVNSIAPGWFPSKMANGLIEAAGDMLTETNPRGRLGQKEDLQNLLVFLCSKQSNYINGVVIPLDGGAHNNSPAAHF